MINWIAIAIGIGLVCVIGAYILAVRGFLQTFELLKFLVKEDNEQSQQIEKILLSMRSAVIGLIAVTGLLIVCFSASVITVYFKSATTEDALCTFRGQLETQVSTTTNFLDEHPKGIPGVPVATLQEGLKRQKIAIHALGSLSC